MEWRRFVPLAATGLALVACGRTEFDPQRFREAAARHDLETMEDQARAAVARKALIGLSPERVRALLGEPSHVDRQRRESVWTLGMINDFAGPGDQGFLVVRFDRSLRRVTAASVEG